MKIIIILIPIEFANNAILLGLIIIWILSVFLAKHVRVEIMILIAHPAMMIKIESYKVANVYARMDSLRKICNVKNAIFHGSFIFY